MVAYTGGASEFKAIEGREPHYDPTQPIKLWRKVYDKPIATLDNGIDEAGETFTVPIKQTVQGDNGLLEYGVPVLTSEFYPYSVAAEENIPPDKGVYAQIDPQAAQQAITKLPIQIDTTKYQLYWNAFGFWVDLIGAE